MPVPGMHDQSIAVSCVRRCPSPRYAGIQSQSVYSGGWLAVGRGSNPVYGSTQPSPRARPCAPMVKTYGSPVSGVWICWLKTYATRIAAPRPAMTTRPHANLASSRSRIGRN